MKKIKIISTLTALVLCMGFISESSNCKHSDNSFSVGGVEVLSDINKPMDKLTAAPCGNNVRWLCWTVLRDGNKAFAGLPECSNIKSIAIEEAKKTAMADHPNANIICVPCDDLTK